MWHCCSNDMLESGILADIDMLESDMRILNVILKQD